MKKSTAFFCFTDPHQNVCILRSHRLPLVETYDQVGFSVVRSLAAYMVWEFPELHPPHKTSYTHRHPEYIPVASSFPNYQSKLHPMYLQWMETICDAVENQRAVRDQQNCYFRIEVNEEYAKVLTQYGFECTPLNRTYFSWNDFLPGLQVGFQENRVVHKPTVCFVSFSDHHLYDEPYLDLKTHYYGLFFDNQKWIEFNVLQDRPPTAEELTAVDVVMIPGSGLAVYEEHPQVVAFMEALTKAVKLNPRLKILGVCFGHQLIGAMFGGKVTRAKSKTQGVESLVLSQSAIQSKGFEFLEPLRAHKELLMTEGHGDEVSVLPENFTVLATSKSCAIEMMVSNCGRYLGMQCHPEFTTKMMLTHDIQVTHHQHKENSVPAIAILLERMVNDKQDEDSEVVRQLIRRFVSVSSDSP